MLDKIERYGQYADFCELPNELANSYEECPATQYFFSCIVNRSGTFCPSPDAMLQRFDKRVTKTLYEIWHSFWTIMPVLYLFAISYLVARQIHTLIGQTKHLVIWRFFIEFIIIALPVVLYVNILNAEVEYIVLILTIGMCYLIYYTDCLKRVLERTEHYDLGGRRPHMLTLSRATINLLTVLSILAVDFHNFPKDFRKSRRFGAALMDTGIGLFAFSMGTVSKRLNSIASLVRLIRQVIPVLLLGVARTILVIAINYHQDEHEYGMHSNAFFTLGLTKLFGSLISAAAGSTIQTTLIGLVITIIHQIGLSVGISDFVMSASVDRGTLFRANREGICSLPGFIGIYLISMGIGQWLQTGETTTGRQLLKKVRDLCACCLSLWLVVLCSVCTVGVARVTCNFGYVAWILSIALTMSTLFLFVFDVVLQTLCPNSSKATVIHDELEAFVKPQVSLNETRVPILAESINYNGLVYFLISNILTGQVNIFLKPEARSSFESIIILVLYMFLSLLVVFVMYVQRIKIA